MTNNVLIVPPSMLFLYSTARVTKSALFIGSRQHQLTLSGHDMNYGKRLAPSVNGHAFAPRIYFSASTNTKTTQ